MNSDSDTAWNDFWAAERAAGKGGGCLPQGWAGIEEAQKRAWLSIARLCRRGARVLDLATGDGRVLRWLRQARPDLKLVGIDAAPQLPAAPQGCKVRAGVRMEKLPFAADKFDLVTSQFGFEYGDAARVAREIARVLLPGGRAALMVHRGDGPILAHNLTRRTAITWALEERDIMGVAKGALVMQGMAANAVQKLGAIAAEGARLFGEGSAAWELPEAVRQTLVLGLQRDPESVGGTLALLEERARNELGRIASLESACGTADAREVMLEHLVGGGLRLEGVQEIAEQGARPFADLIVLRRST